MAEHIISCPYCGDKESHKHCHLNLDKGVFHCFLCGRGGQMRFLLKDFPYLKEVLFGLGFQLPSFREDLTISKLPTFSVFGAGQQAVAGLEYLHLRGMTDSEIRKCKVCMSPKMHEGVVFPDVAEGTEWFWAVRFFGNSRYKWLFPKNGTARLSKKDALWGLWWQKRNSEIWITEGIFDALAVHGVSVFGKKPSLSQLRQILAFNPTRVVVAFDNDAETEAFAVVQQLRCIVPTTMCFPEKEFNDFGEKLQAGWRRE
jgi:hypothetical protein